MGKRQQKRQLVVFDCVIAGLVPKQAEGLGRYLYIRIAGGEGVAVGEDNGFGAELSEL